MELNILAYLVLIPLGIALVQLVLPSVLQKLLLLAGTAAMLWLAIIAGMGEKMTWSLGGIEILRSDPLSLMCLLFAQVLALVVLVFSLKGLAKATERNFLILFPLAIAFGNGALLSDHAVFFMSFWALTGVLLFLMGVLPGNADASQSAKKTFMIIGGSDVFMVLGFVFLWQLQPGTNWSLAALHVNLSGTVSWFAMSFLLIAALAKAGCFPFHTWLPDYSRDTGVEAVVLMPATFDKLLGIYLLARLVTTWFRGAGQLLTVNLVLITIGALSVIIAVMMALTQHDGRRLLGYHAVSQVGYMVMGVGGGSLLAFAGGLFHLVNNVIYKSGLFLTLGSVEKKTGTHDLDKLGGLARSMPITFFIALIMALSISGIPPFNGFFSKWMIYQGLLEKIKELGPAYQLWLLLCLVLAVFGSALTLASFLKFLHTVFLGKRPAQYNDVREAPMNQWLAGGALALLCLGFGLFAVQVPLKMWILPAVGVEPEALVFMGAYQPVFLFILFLIGFLLGLIVYNSMNKVRYDQNYIGGMPALEKYRVSGTGFYNEIRKMNPLKALYDAAEQKVFDLYDQGARITNGFAGLLQKAHPGLLQLYVLYIILGMLIFLLLI